MFREFPKQIGQLAKFCPYATICTKTERTETGIPLEIQGEHLRDF